MPRPSRFVLGFTATVLLLFGFPAAAEQRPNPGSVDGLVSLEDGDTIWVTNADGVERRATFRKLLRVRQDPTAPPGPSDTAVLVVALPSGDEEVPLPQVRRVVTRDEVGNGALVGLLVGGGFGFLMAGPGCADDSDCAFMGPTLILGGIGAGIGLALDAMRQGRDVVYVAPESAARVRVSPFSARHGGGILVSIGF